VGEVVDEGVAVGEDGRVVAVRVRTAHSDYYIDETRKTLRRTRRHENANELTQDGEIVDLIEIVALEVGDYALFRIHLADGRETTRRTTRVEDVS
jgi:hypothetical protein